MKRIERKLAVKVAERDIAIGCGTGVALSLWLLLGLIAFARQSPNATVPLESRSRFLLPG
jgi:hypothetical protein